MKKNTFVGLTAAVMLAFAPTASAAYWTGHSEIVANLIENWVLEHLLPLDTSPDDTPVQEPSVDGERSRNNRLQDLKSRTPSRPVQPRR